MFESSSVFPESYTSQVWEHIVPFEEASITKAGNGRG
jgi:hypothetical protein